MKMYLVCDVGKQWRLGLSKPKWRNNRFGFNMEADDVSICTTSAHDIVSELGHDPLKFKPGEYLEADVT